MSFHRSLQRLVLILAALIVPAVAIAQTAPPRNGKPMRLLSRERAATPVPATAQADRPTEPPTATVTTSVAPLPQAPVIAPTAPAAPTAPGQSGQPLTLRPSRAGPPLQPLTPSGASQPPAVASSGDLKGLVLQQLGLSGGTKSALPGGTPLERVTSGAAIPPPPVSNLPRKAVGSGAIARPEDNQSGVRHLRRFEAHVFQRSQPPLPMRPARKDFDFAKPAEPRYPLDD